MIKIKGFKLIIHKDGLPSMLLMVWLLETVFMTVCRYILSNLGFDAGLFRETVLFFVASIPLILVLIKLPQFRTISYLMFFGILFATLLAIGITFLNHPEYEYYFIRSDYGLIRVLRPECALYAFLFFSLVDEPEKIVDITKKYAVIYFFYLIFIQLMPALLRGYWTDVNYLGVEVEREYSLSFGYNMLFPVIVFLYNFIKERKILYLIFGGVGIFFIFTQGSRGALLMIAIFLGLMIISNIRSSKDASHKTLKIALIIVILIILGIFGGRIINGIANWLQSVGIESRTLTAIIEGNLTNDNGRNAIWLAVYTAIRDGGIFGYGFYGDRPIVYPFHYVGYSHNIFLELVSNFGIIGLAIIVLIIIHAVRMIFICKDVVWRELYIIYFSISCQLLLSMSLWYVWEFWTTAAIAYKYLRVYKRNTKLAKQFF